MTEESITRKQLVERLERAGIGAALSKIGETVDIYEIVQAAFMPEFKPVEMPAGVVYMYRFIDSDDWMCSATQSDGGRDIRIKSELERRYVNLDEAGPPYRLLLEFAERVAGDPMNSYASLAQNVVIEFREAVADE